MTNKEERLADARSIAICIYVTRTARGEQESPVLIMLPDLNVHPPEHPAGDSWALLATMFDQPANVLTSAISLNSLSSRGFVVTWKPLAKVLRKRPTIRAWESSVEPPGKFRSGSA